VQGPQGESGTAQTTVISTTVDDGSNAVTCPPDTIAIGGGLAPGNSNSTGRHSNPAAINGNRAKPSTAATQEGGKWRNQHAYALRTGQLTGTRQDRHSSGPRGWTRPVVPPRRSRRLRQAAQSSQSLPVSAHRHHVDGWEQTGRRSTWIGSARRGVRESLKRLSKHLTGRRSGP